MPGKLNKATGRYKAPPRYKTGTPRSEESKRRWRDPEYRAKMAERMKEVGEKRRGKITSFRTGIPNGMRREEAEYEWSYARFYANRVVKIMKEEGIIEEDPKVEKAFTAAVEVLESPMSQAVKLQAARLILDFCKAKPVAKSEITVQRAEDWLQSVTSDYYERTQGIKRVENEPGDS
jgi:hypothetical protein